MGREGSRKEWATPAATHDSVLFKNGVAWRTARSRPISAIWIYSGSHALAWAKEFLINGFLA